MTPSNAAEQTWVWHSESGDFYFDRNEWVRVRVETEQWHDLSPVAPAEREAVNSMERKSPYSITVRTLVPSRFFTCDEQDTSKRENMDGI